MFCISNRLKLYAGASFGVLLLAVPVAAQDNAVQLGPVRVEGQGTPDANPYADPMAPYKADRLSSSKFTEPILNTPRSETVITKEALDDKNATSLRDVARSARPASRWVRAKAATPLATVSSFAASTRATMFLSMACAIRACCCAKISTPSKSRSCAAPPRRFAGRGTTGGALNIVTKQAQRRRLSMTREVTGGLSDDTQAPHIRSQPGDQLRAWMCASTA